MSRKALVVIDIQNDITKHYRDIIDRLNAAIEWAVESGMEIVYIQHNNLSPGTRTFKPGTKGAELAPELRIVSDHIFVKTKANALTSEPFSEFIRENGINEFFITGADATGCVKSTCFNMTKAGYAVHVISDCVTSYDLKKLPEIGYHIRRDCQRKGYAREAAKAVRDWAFRNTDHPTLYSYCKYTNVPSIKTAESIGMQFVCEYPDETNGTTHVSSISRKEWLDEITENTVC